MAQTYQSRHSVALSVVWMRSEGRTRREASLNLLGAGPQPPASKVITIADPVSGVRYMLDPDKKIAHKMTLSSPANIGANSAEPAGLPEKGEHMMIYQSAGPSAPPVFSTTVFF